MVRFQHSTEEAGDFLGFRRQRERYACGVSAKDDPELIPCPASLVFRWSFLDADAPSYFILMLFGSGMYGGGNSTA